MNVSSAAFATVDAVRLHPPPTTAPPDPEGTTKEVREAFQSFVGETLFGQVLSAMRKTVGKPAYFHGGRAEEIFQAQLDQVLAEKMANAGAEKFSDPMFELFAMKRS